tara:strand:+ start:431 stop:655 length:225 start_codon:yes stop_codon:yes gene_type:complete
MLVLCLILGILAGFGSALFALVSGYGITGIIVAYAIGGAFGFCLGALALLRRKILPALRVSQDQNTRNVQENKR